MERLIHDRQENDRIKQDRQEKFKDRQIKEGWVERKIDRQIGKKKDRQTDR